MHGLRCRLSRMVAQTNLVSVFPVFSSLLACPSAAWITTLSRSFCRLIAHVHDEHGNLNQISLQRGELVCPFIAEPNDEPSNFIWRPSAVQGIHRSAIAVG